METVLLFMPSGQELLLIAVIVLLLFGGKKIPELMRGLGKGVKEFKDASKGVDEEIKESPKPAAEIKNPAPGQAPKPETKKDENPPENVG